MIYYVEDDANVRELALYALKQAGLEVRGFSHADDFFEACEHVLPDAVLLDIMLPDIDGLDILRQLRERKSTAHTPVMMLTAKGTEYDTVVGLDAGADDYLAKPFGMMEFVSRVNALLRRSAAPAFVAASTSDQQSSPDDLVCGPVALSSSRHTVYVCENEVTLTLKEFDLLQALMRNEGKVLSRSQLLEEVWGVSFAGETRTVDVHIQTLRQKLSAAGSGADSCIHTVRGVGYCMKESR